MEGGVRGEGREWDGRGSRRRWEDGNREGTTETEEFHALSRGGATVQDPPRDRGRRQHAGRAAAPAGADAQQQPAARPGQRRPTILCAAAHGAPCRRVVHQEGPVVVDKAPVIAVSEHARVVATERRRQGRDRGAVWRAAAASRRRHQADSAERDAAADAVVRGRGRTSLRGAVWPERGRLRGSDVNSGGDVPRRHGRLLPRRSPQ